MIVLIDEDAAGAGGEGRGGGRREEREGGDHHGEGQGSRATGQVPGMLMRLLGPLSHGLDATRARCYKSAHSIAES